MKTFYSAADIEALAAQGVRELRVDDDTVLTSVARDTAAQLGVRIVPVAPGRPAATPAAASNVPPASGPLGPRPRGCQHGPLTSAGGGAVVPRAAAGGVVDEIIGAVKQMAGQRS